MGYANPDILVSPKWADHLPGATNIEWNLLLENSQGPEGVRKFRTAEDIEAILSSAGLGSWNEIVAHCQAAVRATLMVELIGYPNVGVYDCSMAEWANRDGTPLEY
jgi:thiosulfate/3-mercaptopyruvate sulfurtransferase